MNSYLFLVLLVSFVTVNHAVPCSFSHPGYQVSFGIRHGVVHFRVVLSGVPMIGNAWSGIGFGNSMHSGLDVIVIRIMNGRVFVTDEYVRGFTSPSQDRVNNVQVHNTRIENGRAIVSFSRAAFSSEFPYDTSLSGCQSWKFAVGLSRMSPQGQLWHHSQTPVHRTVCIDQCTV